MDVVFDTISEMFEFMQEITYFAEDGAFKFEHTNNDSPLTIVTGDNASGKSFVRKIIQTMCAKRQPKLECIHLSQAGRCQGGIIRAFVYGSEDDESTGRNTIGTMLTSFKTSHSRDSDHLMIYDEPEIGLSEEYAGGLGIRIKEFIESNPTHLFGAVVITHSSHLLKELLPLNPNHINLSDNRTLDEIAYRKVVPNTNLEGLQERSLETYRKICDIQNEMKKEIN